MDKKDVGLRIKNKRKELKLTQTDIKNKTGISSGGLSDIENGKIFPSAPTLISLSEILNCSIDWILKDKNSDIRNKDTPIKNETKFDIFQLFTVDEIEHLSIYRKLTEDDKEEINEIIKLKLLRKKEKAVQKLLNSKNNDSKIG